MDKKSQGKRNKTAGARFELKVRKDLESKGWIVDKWSNNVEFSNGIMSDKLMKEITSGKLRQLSGKLIPAKRKYNPFKRVMAIGTGFPDFICFRIAEITSLQVSPDRKNLDRFLENLYRQIKNAYEVIGIEVKSNGYLDKVEKAKCKWLLENNIFSKIFVASKDKKKRGGIVYERI